MNDNINELNNIINDLSYTIDNPIDVNQLPEHWYRDNRYKVFDEEEFNLLKNITPEFVKKCCLYQINFIEFLSDDYLVDNNLLYDVVEYFRTPFVFFNEDLQTEDLVKYAILNNIHNNSYRSSINFFNLKKDALSIYACLDIIELDPHIFPHIPHKFKIYPIVLQALDCNIYYFNNVNFDLLNNTQIHKIANKAIKQAGELICSLPKKHQSVDLWKIALKDNLNVKNFILNYCRKDIIESVLHTAILCNVTCCNVIQLNWNEFKQHITDINKLIITMISQGYKNFDFIHKNDNTIFTKEFLIEIYNSGFINGNNKRNYIKFIKDNDFI